MQSGRRFPHAWMATAASGIALEMLAVLHSARLDRPYLAPLVAACAGAELAVAAIVGVVLFACPRRPNPPLDVDPSAPLALGAAVAHGLLFILANGAPPRVPAWDLDPATSIGLALAPATAVCLLRFKATRLFARGAFSVLEGPLVLFALMGGHRLLAALGWPPTSLKALALIAGAALLAYVLPLLLDRWCPPFGTPVRRLIAPALVLLVALAASTAAVTGRPLFPVPSPPRESGPPDVLLIVLDTARADSVPAANGITQPTPALARVAREGATFTRVFSTSCWTVPAHGSLFTGRLPSEHGAAWASSELGPGLPTLAERFAEAGWRTIGFSANPWITPEFGFDRGFERFVVADADHRPLRPWASRLLPSLFSRFDRALLLEDKKGLAVTSEMLRGLTPDAGRPTFAFVNLMEAHLPYAPPRRYLERAAGGDFTIHDLVTLDQDRLRDLRPGGERSAREVEGLRRLYAAEIAHDDFLVGGILRSLERAGRLERTLLVITSDHGENLGQHPPLDHQLGLYDTLIHVPLLVRFPRGERRGDRIDALASLVDLPSALLGWARGDGGDLGPLSGTPRAEVLLEYDRPEHILELIRGRLKLDPRPWERELTAVRTLTQKWIEASDGRHQAFDLAADPGEKTDLFLAQGAVPTGFLPLAERARALRSRLGVRDRAGPSEPIPEESRQKLRSLGYLP